MERENTGKLIHDHLVKTWDDTSKITPMDIAHARMPKYIDDLVESVEKGKKEFEGNFYIDVQRKEERLFKKRVFKDLFVRKQDCPSPNDDQDVFKYNRERDQIEYLWSVPDRNTIQYLIENALVLPESQRGLLEFVMDFTAGTLLKKAKKLNGEKADSPLLNEN